MKARPEHTPGRASGRTSAHGRAGCERLAVGNARQAGSTRRSDRGSTRSMPRSHRQAALDRAGRGGAQAFRQAERNPVAAQHDQAQPAQPCATCAPAPVSAISARRHRVPNRHTVPFDGLRPQGRISRPPGDGMTTVPPAPSMPNRSKIARSKESSDIQRTRSSLPSANRASRSSSVLRAAGD